MTHGKNPPASAGDSRDLGSILTSPVAQTVKCLPTTQETWVWSLGQEDLLEKEMATHSSIVAWKIPWTEEPGRLQSMGSQRVGHDWVTFTYFGVGKIPWRSKWQPLQYSCLGNGRGTWRATVHGVQTVGHDWVHTHISPAHTRVSRELIYKHNQK